MARGGLHRLTSVTCSVDPHVCVRKSNVNVSTAERHPKVRRGVLDSRTVVSNLFDRAPRTVALISVTGFAYGDVALPVLRLYSIS